MMLKVNLPFVVVFIVLHCAVLLPPSDVEFVLSLIAIPFCFCVLMMAYYAARHENKPLMVLVFLVLLGTVGYFAYKAYRFASKTCTQCESDPDLGTEKSFVFLTLFCTWALFFAACTVWQLMRCSVHELCGQFHHRHDIAHCHAQL